MITLCIVAYLAISLGFTISDHGESYNSVTNKYVYTSWKSAFKFGFAIIPCLVIAAGLFIGFIYASLFIITKILQAASWIYHNMP